MTNIQEIAVVILTMTPPAIIVYFFYRFINKF